MTREEALRYWEWHLERAEEWSDPHWEASERKAHKEYVDAMKMAIEALKAQTGLISKQDAIEIIRNRIEKSEVGESVDHDQVIADIKSLPSADRTEQGRWEIKQDTDEYGLKRPKLVCSKCEKEPAAWDLTELFEFCPNCGARMMKNGKG